LTENREKNEKKESADEKKENDYEKKESADEKKENDYEKKESADEKKEIDNDGGSDDEEETLVVKFEIKGVIYLKSSDNVLYDMMSHDVIGIWNEERSEIDEIPEEYEE